MADFGYDIADYRAVDPIFGTLADFDRLMAKAHGLGLKVIIDQVLSHTSDQHAWFHESRQSRTNPQGRLVRVGRCARGWHAAEQLAVDIRRRRLDLGAAPRPVLPAQFPQRAAGPEFPQPGSARGGARQHALLARARRRWPAPRRDQLLLSRRAAARQPAAAAERARKRARLQRRQSVRLPMAPLQQYAAGDAALPRRASAKLLDEYPGRRGARRNLLRRFDRDGCRVHAARPAAHGIQLRVAEQRQLAAAHPRHGRRRCCSARPRAGRAGPSPTTTSSAWSAAGAGAGRSCRTSRPS